MEKVEEVKTVNHWGKWVSSDQPVTGVIGFNHLPGWFYDYMDSGIDLACVDCHDGDDGGCINCESSGPILVGSWKQGAQGLYEPDETGDYAAIVREDVVQVVFSKTTKKGALCSPCYPGQVDLDTPGEFLGFALPEE